MSWLRKGKIRDADEVLYFERGVGHLVERNFYLVIWRDLARVFI